MNNLNFITVEPEKTIEELVSIYKKETDTEAYPAQDAMILIRIIVYLSTLLKTKFNDSAKLNLVRHSRYPFLDFLGEMKNCKRLENESDEDYIERIILSPEGFSVAGPELAYIYFALSADSDIADVTLDCPDDNISIAYNEMVTVLEGSEAVIQKDTEHFNISADYNKNEVTLRLKKNLTINDVIKIKIPHPYELLLYILTHSGKKEDELLEKILKTLKPSRPLSDCVRAQYADIEEFVISGTIYLKKEAVEKTVKDSVNEILNAFLNDFKDVLNKSVIKNQIITSVCKIQGVYDFDLKTPEKSLEAKKNISYKGVIGELKFERVLNE